MTFWQIFLVVAIIALILEMFSPMMFFLSIAVASVITAVCSLFYGSIQGLIIICSVLSVLILFLIRPFMKKIMHEMPKSVDFDSEYIGKIVKVTEEITDNSGAIAIYGERWDARLADKNAQPIAVGEDVKIVKNESIVLFVEIVQ